MGVRWQQWMPFRPPLLPADKPTSIKHRGQYKYIGFYINLLNLTKSFNSGLKKWMHKAARHSDGVDSSNPRCWRGKRLHHHGGGVCWLFVLLWMDSWCHELIICKKWDKNKLKMRLKALLFDPPRCAPHCKRVFDLTKYTHLLADSLSIIETEYESFLETVQPKTISRRNKKLTQRHNWYGREVSNT